MSGMRALPLPEVDDLLPTLPAKYAAIAAIGVTTGCRISEILALRRFDLLDRNGRLRDGISFLKLKTRKNSHRRIGIPARFRPYVLRHLMDEERRGWERPDDWVFRGHNGGHLSRIAVYRFFRPLLGERHGTHWMRKTFGQEIFRYYLRQSGDGIRALELTRKALGHARLDTTVKYLGIEEQELEEAQEKIFG